MTIDVVTSSGVLTNLLVAITGFYVLVPDSERCLTCPEMHLRWLGLRASFVVETC